MPQQDAKHEIQQHRQPACVTLLLQQEAVSHLAQATHAVDGIALLLALVRKIVHRQLHHTTGQQWLRECMYSCLANRALSTSHTYIGRYQFAFADTRNGMTHVETSQVCVDLQNLLQRISKQLGPLNKLQL